MSAAIGIRFASSLALVVALGPIAVDMYLASMPHMTQEFSVSYAAMQLTLSVYLICLGFGQLMFGPLTDAVGRRLPMLVGIAAYVLASIGAALSPNLEILIIARIVQGLGAAVAIVSTMSVVRDIAEGDEATKLYALLNTIVALGPILAPVIGGFIDEAFGWQGVMWCMALAGILVLINSMLSLPETLSSQKRIPLQLGSLWSSYKNTLRNKILRLRLLTLSVILLFVFNYISGAAFVYQTAYGMSASGFGLAFGLTAGTLVLGAMSIRFFIARLQEQALLYIGAVVMAVGGAVALGAELIGVGVMGVITGMAISIFAIGILEATNMASAMNSQESSLGVAAALLGAIPMMLGSLGTYMAGVLVEISVVHWLVSLSVMGPLVLVLVHWGRKVTHS